MSLAASKANSHTVALKKAPESAPVTSRGSHSTAASNEHPPASAAAAKKPASAAPAAKKESEKKEKEEKPAKEKAAAHPPASARDRPRTASGKTPAAADKAGKAYARFRLAYDFFDYCFFERVRVLYISTGEFAYVKMCHVRRRINQRKKCKLAVHIVDSSHSNVVILSTVLALALSVEPELKLT